MTVGAMRCHEVTVGDRRCHEVTVGDSRCHEVPVPTQQAAPEGPSGGVPGDGAVGRGVGAPGGDAHTAAVVPNAPQLHLHHVAVGDTAGTTAAGTPKRWHPKKVAPQKGDAPKKVTPPKR